MKIKIFYSNNMKKHDDSARLLGQALKICAAERGAAADPENGGCNNACADADDVIKVARPARGRPYAENAPWLSFSVTHTGSMWICAAAQPAAPLTRQKDAAKAARPPARPAAPAAQPARPAAAYRPCEPSLSPDPAAPPLIGIDAEYADRRILRPEKISEKYFSEKEKAYAQDRAAASCRGAIFAPDAEPPERPAAQPRPCGPPSSPDPAARPAAGASAAAAASTEAGPCTRAPQNGSAVTLAPASAPFIKTWTIKEAYLKTLGTGITDDAKNLCALSDTRARFIPDEQLADIERELSAAAGRQLIISLCIMPQHGAQLEDTAPELEILQLH